MCRGAVLPSVLLFKAVLVVVVELRILTLCLYHARSEDTHQLGLEPCVVRTDIALGLSVALDHVIDLHDFAVDVLASLHKSGIESGELIETGAVRSLGDVDLAQDCGGHQRSAPLDILEECLP